jgi:hypothetical protein
MQGGKRVNTELPFRHFRSPFLPPNQYSKALALTSIQLQIQWARFQAPVVFRGEKESICLENKTQLGDGRF